MTKHLSVLPHPIRDLYKVPFKELGDVEFYTSDRFVTATEIILTYGSSRDEYANLDNFPSQTVFEVIKEHSLDDDASDIAKSILRETFSKCEFCLERLIKVSMCHMWWGKYEEREKEKLLGLGNNSKYYFQPDQRCQIVEDLIKENPKVASKTKPFKDLYKVPFKELPHKEEVAREFDFISETGGKK